jgi:hypothetical protein
MNFVDAEFDKLSQLQRVITERDLFTKWWRRNAVILFRPRQACLDKRLFGMVTWKMEKVKKK